MTSEEFADRIAMLTQTLYRVCYAQLPRACDREDAVQNALEKAWRHRDRVKDTTYFETYLIRIVINECHNIQRRLKREFPGEMPEERVAPQMEDSALHDELLALEAKYRLPLVLHYMQGYSIEEIARMMRIPQGTVKTRLRRGREKLANALKREAFIDARQTT